MDPDPTSASLDITFKVILLGIIENIPCCIEKNYCPVIIQNFGGEIVGIISVVYYKSVFLSQRPNLDSTCFYGFMSITCSF